MKKSSKLVIIGFIIEVVAVFIKMQLYIHYRTFILSHKWLDILLLVAVCIGGGIVLLAYAYKAATPLGRWFYKKRQLNKALDSEVLDGFYFKK